MKVTIRKINDKLSVYVAKKDLELEVIKSYEDENGYFFDLSNGWKLMLPEKIESYPKTLEVKKL